MTIATHQSSEIKGTTWEKRGRQLRWLNDALTQALTAADQEWREFQRQRYLNLLPAVHINGAAGSLLDADAQYEPIEDTYIAQEREQADYDATMDAAANRWGF